MRWYWFCPLTVVKLLPVYPTEGIDWLKPVNEWPAASSSAPRFAVVNGMPLMLGRPSEAKYYHPGGFELFELNVE